MVYWDETSRLVRKFRPSVQARHQVMKSRNGQRGPLENIEDCQKMHGLLGRNFTVSEKISTYCPSGHQVMKESKRSKRPPGKHRGLPENAWFVGTKLHG